METRWGKRFGRYEIVAELGRGAMGTVYKARDPKIDRFVAVKTISLGSHAREEQREYRERFFQEAQAAGRLVHSGIVTIFDVGEDPETREPYIVMEYVAGVPLNGMLVEGEPVPWNTALRLTQQIAEALDCAHAQGIVHRDIKPANIMVTGDGQAKIMDFGIAKLNLTHLTVPGRSLGTPAYISPEQLNGESVDGRSDIFSLGVILYSMLTGYRPFQGTSVITVCFKVANQEPLAPTVLDPNLPRELDAIIARAMAKNPADRYQRGMELALDVAELLEGRTPASSMTTRSAHDASPATSRRVPAVAAVPSRSSASILSRAIRLTPRKVLTVGVCVAVLAFVGLRRSRSSGQSTIASSAEGVIAAPVGSMDAAPADPAVPSHATVAIPSRRATAPSSTLNIQINHHFADGKVSVWVDGDLKYSHSLHAETRKRLLLFHSSQGREFKDLPISAGQHHVRVRAQSQSDAYDQREELSSSFPSGSRKTLFISFDGPRKAMRVALK